MNSKDFKESQSLPACAVGKPDNTSFSLNVAETRSERWEPFDDGTADMIQAANTGEALRLYIPRVTKYVVDVIQPEIESRRSLGEWMTPTLWVVRWFGSHRDLTALTESAAWNHCHSAAPRKFQELAELCEYDEETFSTEWEALWPKVKSLPSIDVLERAWRMARECKTRLKPTEHGRRSTQYPRFINLAAWLANYAPDKKTIFLPTARIATLFEKEPKTISRYRSFAEANGLLERVKRGGVSSGLADVFHFNLDAFQALVL